ncbi:related to sporulation protein SPO72 [Cephalotrichum gorgonifer]|uniref:Autophagy-related protein 2 n=1 Tax=Cephalotrichum gorgonifer TaxID=2041049 RepID=A0AAE8SRG1_9PEZI|nr:related to sporulation protein SPO72 [Cephalotrichum gorgonifer]
MAAMFQSLRSSSMPKRLLRYALSRLELLDADALDVDNLDLALGRNTVFEFRDVGIKLKKLQQILKLPPSYELLKAKVLLLRITIPVDFYNSPITVEVEGVDVRVRVASHQPPAQNQTPRQQKDRTAGVVPNTADLAESFLEDQPEAEKKKLEEALAAETHDLGASVSVSDDGSEEEASLGTGQPLSLPAFLADFLQGIVDRTQVRINAVTFQLDVEVPIESQPTALDTLTFQIALEAINVEGVTAQDIDEDGRPTIVHREGKRHVSLSNIRAYLVSEANVFSAFARSPSVASPAVSQSPVQSHHSSFHREPSSFSSPNHYGGDSLSESTGSQPEEHFLRDSEIALNIPYDFSDDPEEDADDPSPSTPRASGFPDLIAFEPTASVSQSVNFEEAQPPWASVHRESHSVGGLDSLEIPDPGLLERPQTPEGPSSDANSDTSSQGDDDNLAQSHVFSHEDAESMYASAFSEQPIQPSRTMPGAWENYGSPDTSPRQGADDHTTSDDLERSIIPGSQSRPEYSLPYEDAEPLAESVYRTFEDVREQHTESSGECGDRQESEGNREPEAQLPASDDNAGNATEEFAQFSQAIEDGPASPQDQTPRGPTRIVKEIVTLKNISIYAPLHHKHIYVHPGPSLDGQASHLGSSTSPHLPGAFSVYSSHESAHGSFVSSEEPTAQSPKQTESDNSLEVTLSPVDIKFDASLGFLLATVVSRLLDAANSHSGPPATSPAPQQPNDTESSSVPDIKLEVERVSLHFLHHLMGVADTPERILNPSAFEFDQVTLLRSDVENLSVNFQNIKSEAVTLITLGKFRLGYADSDILSFDRTLKLGASVRDVFPPADADVSVKLTRSGDVTKAEVTTLSLVAQLDLRRLDETFGWFGGLSSFLNMGSSMSSASPTVASAQVSKARGVRFETPISPEDRTSSSENKVDMRTGGFYLHLIGKECDVSLETSAVKLVKRNEGVGIAINAINMSGPYLRNSRAPPSIRIDIEGTRLEYLPYPQEVDLDRLLKLITPSNLQPDLRDDEIMVDTLLRQRRKGPVLRVTLDSVRARVGEMHQLDCLPALGEEIARLATVAKYLPEDDRPGILSLGRIKKISLSTDLAGKIGLLDAYLRELEVAHISIPSLVAVGVDSITLSRNGREELISSPKSPATAQDLAVTARMIGDEMEPIFKVRLQGLAFEYRVPTLMDLLGLGNDATPQDFEAELAASVANLGEHAHAAFMRQQTQSPELSKGKGKQSASKPLTVDMALRDCLLGLNPLGLQSKLCVVLTDARLRVTLPKDDHTSADLELRKASIILIDDVAILNNPAPVRRPRSGSVTSMQVSDLCSRGYVEICFISSAKAGVAITTLEDGEKQVDVSFRDDLLVMETCADSTQTLIALANALKPPTPPSKEIKYRTNVLPVEDLLASISAEAFGNPEGEYDFDKDFAIARELQGDIDDDVSDLSQLEFHEGYYDEPEVTEKLFDATSSSVISLPTSEAEAESSNLRYTSPKDTVQIDTDADDLVVREDWFVSDAPTKGAAHVWNSTRNTYDRAPMDLVKKSPLKVTIRDVHVIWNLFDGYDWTRTREVIAKAVEEVEAKATERRRARTDGPTIYDEELEEEEDVIGDFLFNSIYIGIPANRDARDLTRAINQDLNDNGTETESVATTTFTTSTARAGGHRPNKKLKLSRSKRHKVTFELQGVDVDLISFPPGSGETESSIDVRVKNLDVLDNVPTSTWKKFATYDRDAGERELGSSMVHIEMLNVRPHPDLAASEIVMRVTVLPLRLHVDQDALDFITRFFEFKDDEVVVHQSPSDVPFLQRVEVNDIPVKLDFKPKRVDYAGLRSGRTTEFMNFVILDEARMVLRHTIIYGVLGFERLGKTLNDVWMPDVKKNQLPSVLAGLAPVRSIVNVGSGIKNLIEIPMKEYKKDGRIVRSISKGASAFVRTTGTEIIKLGAKVAVGTQYALQGAEGLLVPKTAPEPREYDEDESEEPKKISLYADQPMGVIQGLRGGYASLSRDLNLARDAIIAVPGAVMDSQNAQGAARAVLNKAPTIIFRPAIGATKALGQTLLGATNTLDPHNKRRIDEKYKKR